MTWCSTSRIADVPAVFYLLQQPCACPICGARQEWSPECRRCGGDLGLLLDLARHHDATVRRCLGELAAGRPRTALSLALHVQTMRSGEDVARLIACCRLLCGDWQEAMIAAADLGRET